MAGRGVLDLLEAGSRRELALTLLHLGRHEAARALYLAVSRLFDPTHPDEHPFSCKFLNATRFVVGGHTVVLTFVAVQTLAELREHRETCKGLLLDGNLFHAYVSLNSETYGRACMEAMEASAILESLWTELEDSLAPHRSLLVSLQQCIYTEALKQFTRLDVSTGSERHQTLPITYLVSNLSTLKGDPAFPINPREGLLGLHYLSTRFGCDIISLSKTTIPSSPLQRSDGVDVIPDIIGGIDAVLEKMLLAINEDTPSKAATALQEVMVEGVGKGIPWHPLGYSLMKLVIISIMCMLNLPLTNTPGALVELFRYAKEHISPVEAQQPVFLPDGWLMPTAILSDLQTLVIQGHLDLEVTWDLTLSQYKQLLVVLLQGLTEKQRVLEPPSLIDSTHANVVATEALYRHEFEAAMKEAMNYVATQEPMEPAYNPPQAGSTLALSHIQSIDASIDVQQPQQQQPSFLSGSSLFSRSRVPIARSRHAVTFMDPTSSSTDPISESA